MTKHLRGLWGKHFHHLHHGCRSMASIFLPFEETRDSSMMHTSRSHVKMKCSRNNRSRWLIFPAACVSAGSLTAIPCVFPHRLAPISTTAEPAWPSALSRLCTTPRPFSWSTTPEPSTPMEPSASRSAHVSVLQVAGVPNALLHAHSHSCRQIQIM